MENRYTLKQLRHDQYALLRERFPYAFQKQFFPYRKYKFRIYIEGGCLLAYWCLRLGIHANYVTALYALMGISGGILLALPSKATTLVACGFFFLRGILDGGDGIVARKSNQASLNGTVFDSYGAHVGWVFLWAGLGIYLGYSTDSIFFLLAPIIPVFFAADAHVNAFNTFVSHRLFNYELSSKEEVIEKQEIIVKKSIFRKIKDIIDLAFVHNARTLDLLVLFIIIETFTIYRIVWIYFSLYLIWLTIIFLMRLALITRGGWAEAQLREIQSIIKNEDK